MARIASHFGWTVFFLCLCGMGAGQAWGTVVVSQTLDQMIHSASRIVRGQVIQKRYMWGPGQRYIYTELKIRVLEQLKGETQQEIVVRKLGGVMDTIATKVPGTATYRLQEEVVLFLESQRPGKYYFVMNLAAGKYEVMRQSGQIWLKRDLHGLTFHRPLGQPRDGSSVYHLNYTEVPLTLGALRQAIQRQASRPALPSPSTTGPKLQAPRPQADPSLRALPSTTTSPRDRMLFFLQRWRAARVKRLRRAPGVVLRQKKAAPVRARPGVVVRPLQVAPSSKQGGAGR